MKEMGWVGVMGMGCFWEMKEIFKV